MAGGVQVMNWTFYELISTDHNNAITPARIKRVSTRNSSLIPGSIDPRS
jgi:hypothetical protein